MVFGSTSLLLGVDSSQIIKDKKIKIFLAKIINELDKNVQDKKISTVMAKMIAGSLALLKEIAQLPDDKALKILEEINNSITSDGRIVVFMSHIIQQAFAKAVIRNQIDVETIKKQVDKNKHIFEKAVEYVYEAYIFNNEDKNQFDQFLKIVTSGNIDSKALSAIDAFAPHKRIGKLNSIAVKSDSSNTSTAEIYKALKTLKTGEFSSPVIINDSSDNKLYLILKLISVSDLERDDEQELEYATTSIIEGKIKTMLNDAYTKYVDEEGSNQDIAQKESSNKHASIATSSKSQDNSKKT